MPGQRRVVARPVRDRHVDDALPVVQPGAGLAGEADAEPARDGRGLLLVGGGDGGDGRRGCRRARPSPSSSRAIFLRCSGATTIGSSSSSAIANSDRCASAVVPWQARHPVLGVEDEHPMLGQVDRRPDDGYFGGAVGKAGRRVGEVEFPWLHGDFGMSRFEVADQAEQQVRSGADEIAEPDPAVVRRDRDEVVDGGVDPVAARRPPWAARPRRARSARLRGCCG